MPKAMNTKLGQRRKAVHPSSRKAAQLTRGAHKKEKRNIQEAERSLRQNVLLEKLRWFHERIDPDKSAYSREEVCHLIDEYLQRFEEELEQIDIVHGIKNRQGRQHAAREDAIKTTLDKEQNEYTTCGLEVPDLMNGKHFNFFKVWNGDCRYLTAIKLRHVKAMESKTTDLPDSTDNLDKEDITERKGS
ncbi:translation machinery-associated protein 16-like [Glandiceps talaboti]